MKELQRAEDYFPYIGHNLDSGVQPSHGSLWKSLIRDLLEPANVVAEEDRLIITNPGKRDTCLFTSVIVKGMKAQRQIAADPESVEAIIPRHRSLYDYCIHMPVHSKLINPQVMLMAGHNLFIAKYSELLRDYGAIVFVRNDTFLTRKGYPKAYITQNRYIKDVLPAYLKQEMIDGVGEKRVRRDLVLYPGQEKDPVSHVRSGGRTKTGHLRKLNPIFFEKFGKITRGSRTKFFVTPVCISFSKYADAPYIVHSSPYKGVLKTLRYLLEQNFIYKGYGLYAQKHPAAKFEVIINYGKPIPFCGDDFKSMRDIFHFVDALRENIGLLECIFPLTLIYQAMAGQSDVALDDLNNRTQKLYEQYARLGIGLEKVSESPGRMMNIGELVEASLVAVNSNPPFHIQGLQPDRFLTFEAGRLYSHDARLQNWYTNLLAHLHTGTDE